MTDWLKPSANHNIIAKVECWSIWPRHHYRLTTLTARTNTSNQTNKWQSMWILGTVLTISLYAWQSCSTRVRNRTQSSPIQSNFSSNTLMWYATQVDFCIKIRAGLLLLTKTLWWVPSLSWVAIQREIFLKCPCFNVLD